MAEPLMMTSGAVVSWLRVLNSDCVNVTRLFIKSAFRCWVQGRSAIGSPAKFMTQSSGVRVVSSDSSLMTSILFSHRCRTDSGSLLNMVILLFCSSIVHIGVCQ